MLDACQPDTHQANLWHRHALYELATRPAVSLADVRLGQLPRHVWELANNELFCLPVMKRAKSRDGWFWAVLLIFHRLITFWRIIRNPLPSALVIPRRHLRQESPAPRGLS